MIYARGLAAHAAAMDPTRPAVVAGEETITRGELAERVARAAASLHRMGIGPGDRVAWAASLSVDAIVLLLGLMQTGATACPLSPRWPEALVAESLPNLGKVVRLGPEEVRQIARSRQTPVTGPEPESARIVIFTSGSSGQPKAVLHEYRQYLWAAQASQERLPMGPGDCWLLSLPIYHVGGLGVVFRSLLAGARIELADGQESLAPAVASRAVTHLSLVPTQLYRLLQVLPNPGPAQKVTLIGGAPLADSLRDRALAAGWPLATTYGCTELCSQIATSQPGDPRQRLIALPRRELAIAADGEILVKSSSQALAYLVGGEERPARDAAGWYHTGDLGELDDRGVLTVTGRADNQFISGGENIQPEQIERQLLELPAVIQAVVVPLDDPEWGQRPVAFVELAEGARLEPEAFRQALRRRLPGPLVPTRFLPWPAEGAGGMKVSRRRLAELAKGA